MGVIDINIPEYITVPPADGAPGLKSEHGSNSNPYSTGAGVGDVAYASTATDLARKEGEKLAGYLWENYVEPYEFPGGIFLMGTGHAFHAVAKLVSDNGMASLHSPVAAQ